MADSTQVDPFYESIDCSNQWCDLTQDGGEVKDLDTYWATKQGSSDNLATALNKMSLDSTEFGSPQHDQENQSKHVHFNVKKQISTSEVSKPVGITTVSVPVKDKSVKKPLKETSEKKPSVKKQDVKKEKKSSKKSTKHAAKDSVFERLFGLSKEKNRRNSSATPRGKKSKNKSMFRSNAPKSARKYNARRSSRASGRDSSRRTSNASARSNGAQKARRQAWGLTKPKSPNLYTKRRSKKANTESSLEKEMREVQKLHMEAEKRRRLNAEQLQRILVPRSDAQFVRRSTKPLTEPQEFSFVTASRLGYKAPKVASVKKRKPRTSLKPTQPVPFSFQSSRRKSKVPKSARKKKYVPLKAKVNNFFKKQTRKSTAAHLKAPGILTQPKSPHMMLKMRQKPPTGVLSTEEKEIQMMQNVKAFKAKAINSKIFTSGGEYGVPRVEKRKPTEFKEFNLSTFAPTRKSVVKEEFSQFKATPFNAKIFQKTPKARKSRAALTQPISPDLMTKNLVHKYIKDTVVPKEEPKKESKPTFEPGRTIPVEFNLSTEQRGKLHEREMKYRLEMEQQQEQEAMKPKALPMPKFKPVKEREEVIRVTEPEPFNLQSEQLHKQAKKEFEEKVAQQLQEEHNRANSFKAQEIKWNDNFFLFASRKPLTTSEPFNLMTQARESQSMDKRAEFARIREEYEQQKKDQEAAKKAREEAEDREWRAQCVHKPLKIMEANPVVVQKSTKPLTQPATPPLKTKERAH